jgi:hypothetical protein
MIDPFAYQPPNEVTAPKHSAIRAAEVAARAAIQQQIGGGSWQGDHAGHYDAQAAYTAINDACRDFYAAIQQHAPPSADRAAAERCVRLARMAANEAVTTPTPEILAQCADNLRAARWQACAAIALGAS